jgi:hypothetical protein
VQTQHILHTGQNIKLPEGYRGVLCHLTSSRTGADTSQGCDNSQGEGSQDDMDGTSSKQQQPVRTWDAVASFDSVTYMNHDAVPARADPQRRVLVDWLELAVKVSGNRLTAPWRGVGCPTETSMTTNEEQMLTWSACIHMAADAHTGDS